MCLALSHVLMEKLVKLQQKAVYIDGESFVPVAACLLASQQLSVAVEPRGGGD